MYLAWQSVSGRFYSVFFTDRLGDEWLPDASFTNVPGSGGLLIYTNTMPASNRFYRLKAER